MVEWPNVTPVQYFCSGFDHACISCKFLLLTRKPDKIRFCNVYYLLYEHIKRFVWIYDDIFDCKGRIGNRYKLMIINVFCRCTIAEKRISQQFFFAIYFSIIECTSISQ